MFVTIKQRSIFGRTSTMLMLAFGICFGTGAFDSAQAARFVGAKKTATNFNKKVKIRKARVRKLRVRKLRRKKARIHKTVKFRKLRRALKRPSKNSLLGLPSTRRLKTKTTGRRYRGLHPRLRRLLATVGKHYGRPAIVSSGCRSYRHNRRVGGARRSMHLRCMAADIKVSGVSKGSLRRYVSRLAGRGGVGTYCGRSIVHLDVGPRRSWYHGCRKRRRRSRRS